MNRKRKPSRQAFWTNLRKEVWYASTKSCVVCHKPLDQMLYASAHLHPLGAGRSRYNSQCKCHVCGLMLNTVENLVVTCFLGPCNNIAANRWRETVGCCRPQEKDDV